MKSKEVKKLLTEYSRLARLSDKMLKGTLRYTEVEDVRKSIDDSKRIVKETRRKLREV